MEPSFKDYFDKLTGSLDAIHADIRGHTAMLDDLAQWRPDLEKRVDQLAVAVAELQQARPAPTEEGQSAAARAPPPPTPPAPLRDHVGTSKSAEGDALGSIDHGIDVIPRGLAPAFASVATPANGQFPLISPSITSPYAHASQLLAGIGQAHPSIGFPQFTGENPRLWKTLCEQYFHMFGIQERYWVPMASLNFTGAASVWLQSVQKKLSELDWESFSSLLCTRFGRDRHRLLIRQFYSLTQKTTVAEYIEQFELIISHLSAYSESIHPYYYLTRFVEGLRADIRAVVLVQRPPDLDTACALALLQEEVADGVAQERVRTPPARQNTTDWAGRGNASTPMVLPPPPPQGRPPTPTTATDWRAIDANRAEGTKLKALREYRRARGLCFKCGERWGQEHTRPTSVQLHVVEELLELFSIDSPDGPPTPRREEQHTETAMAISRHALTGSSAPKAIRLHAWLQGREVLVLVDSGSSTSFLDACLASSLSGVVHLRRPCRVKVADGGELCCVSHIPKCCWTTQGQEFTTDMKILPLGAYDAIVGMDWLEEHSPMNVDWRGKHMLITTPQGPAHLQGHSDGVAPCSEINGLQLYSLQRQGALSQVIQLCQITEGDEIYAPTPDNIQAVIDQFSDVFGEPTELPPRRACDHRIPLMPGAQLVNLRPYRQKPEHKDEIEKQVREMLKAGIIQRSHSPFSSPVILVKKKDGTWPLCVDYRHLNAMTIVGKYPVPVIEELLDELHGAQWFSKLDLRAGYHQIRLADGEEFKTAFQTHSGHFEFKVLSFGLAGGPATFIEAVTDTLQPLLRECVLSFFDDILVFSKTLEAHAEHLRQVFTLLRRDQWKVKLSKCAFGQQRISYLGHVISAEGVATDPSKIKDVVAWPTPTNVKEVRDSSWV
nr:uncharacterized protein LOC120976091 [Aegilops tauschii subsp. strangulata]